MVCVPALSVYVVNFATPELKVLLPSVVVPSMKVTFPVTAPPNSGITIAVKVTDCPNFDGLSEEDSVVVVLALFTT
jgi:hypothetical protein